MCRIEPATVRRRAALCCAPALLALAAWLAACTCEEKREDLDVPDPGSFEEHTLVYGGDVTLGRRINRALFDERRRGSLFGDIEGDLRGAELTIVNGEGVIASGGRFTDKGEPRPYMFRAHPLAIDALSDAGVDVVTVGNNHAGDYGRAALAEMLDRLLRAGISYTGGGQDSADARRPAYLRVGDTVVAVVGVDLTVGGSFRAGEDRPGTLYFDAYRNGRNNDRVVEELGEIHDAARRHAQLVLLTPHWGENWKDRPADHIRKLARRLIEAGYDAIIGHSAHWFQGVELIDGKPVIYDAGNLLVDYGGGDRAHEAFLWELTFDRAGVERLRGIPLWLVNARTDRATGKRLETILGRLKPMMEELGTGYQVVEGEVIVECVPGSLRGPLRVADPPARKVPGQVREAPSQRVIEALPERATSLEVRYPDGISLVGYELYLESLPVPKAGQVVALYWRADEKPSEEYSIHVEGRSAGEDGRGRRNVSNHIPGDWMLPTTSWPPGEVIRDMTLLRLRGRGEPGETVRFFAALAGDGGLIDPLEPPAGTESGPLVPLGEATYRQEAPRVFDVIETHRSKHGI